MKVIISTSAIDIKAKSAELAAMKKDRAGKEKEIARLDRERQSLTVKIAKLSAIITRAKEKGETSAPASTSPAPKVSGVLSPAEMKKTPFNHKAMSGKEWFAAINGKSKAMSKVDGYWREKYSTQLSGLPFPVIMSVPGYNKTEFLAALAKAEKSASSIPQKGFSPHRWTGRSNGGNEFNLGGWRWPQGYRTYLSAGVPPSAKFYEFIMGKTCKRLPTYGRN